MKKLYTIIFAIMLLAGWTGCQTVEPEVPSKQSELIAMQGSYVVTKFIDGSTYTLKLKDKDGNVKEMSLKKDEATSVKEENKHLTGPIPENIGDMSSLIIISAGMCALSGTIPESLFKLKNLFRFDVACNFLEGEFDLSRLTEFPKLDMFSIDGNMQGVGNVPDFIRDVSFNNNGYFYHYGYGELWSCEEQVYFNTPDMLAERLAEE